MRKSWDTPELKKKFNEYKYRARSKGIVFDMEKYMFHVRCIQDCYICGTAADPFNGIDRINNEGGYTKSNTAACCWECNRAKNDMTLEEFERWLGKLKTTPSEDYKARTHKMKLCEKWNVTDYSFAHMCEIVFNATGRDISKENIPLTINGVLQ